LILGVYFNTALKIYIDSMPLAIVDRGENYGHIKLCIFVLKLFIDRNSLGYTTSALTTRSHYLTE